MWNCLSVIDIVLFSFFLGPPLPAVFAAIFPVGGLPLSGAGVVQGGGALFGAGSGLAPRRIVGEQLTAYDAFVQGCCRATRLAAALRCCIGLRPGTGLSAVNLPDSIRSTARAVPLQAAGDDVLLSADLTDAGAAKLAGGTCGYPGLTGTSLLSAPYGPALGTVPGPGAAVKCAAAGPANPWTERTAALCRNTFVAFMAAQPPSKTAPQLRQTRSIRLLGSPRCTLH